MMCWQYLGIMTLVWYQCESNIRILYMSNDTSVSGESQHKDRAKVSNKNLLKDLFVCIHYSLVIKIKNIYNKTFINNNNPFWSKNLESVENSSSDVITVGLLLPSYQYSRGEEPDF